MKRTRKPTAAGAADRKSLGLQLAELWAELEEDGVAEMAAYHVACERLGVDPDDGWDLLDEAHAC